MSCPDCGHTHKFCSECGSTLLAKKTQQSKDVKTSVSGEDSPNQENEDLTSTHNTSTKVPEDNDQNKMEDVAKAEVVKDAREVVVKDFIKQYYLTLSVLPEYLYRFYHADASWLHAGLDETVEPVIHGRMPIQAKVMGQNYREREISIENLTFKPSGNGSDQIMVKVTGIQSASAQPRKFYQTFELTPNTENIFYIRTDVLMYREDIKSSWVVAADEHDSDWCAQGVNMVEFKQLEKFAELYGGRLLSLKEGITCGIVLFHDLESLPEGCDGSDFFAQYDFSAFVEIPIGSIRDDMSATLPNLAFRLCGNMTDTYQVRVLQLQHLKTNTKKSLKPPMSMADFEKWALKSSWSCHENKEKDVKLLWNPDDAVSSMSSLIAQLKEQFVSKPEIQDIFDLVANNLDQTQMSSALFLRPLMMTICEAAVNGEDSTRPGENEIDKVLIKKGLNILSKYLGMDNSKQLQALYALQALFVTLGYPEGVLYQFFDILYSEKVISNDTFRTWEACKLSDELNGKMWALYDVSEFTKKLKLSSKTDETLEVDTTQDDPTLKLIKLIFNPAMFVEAMTTLGLDMNELPSLDQRLKALHGLKKLEEAINKSMSETRRETMKKQWLAYFYKTLPHTRKTTATNMTMKDVEGWHEMLQALEDIQLAKKLSESEMEKSEEGETVDYQQLCNSLKCKLTLVDKYSEEFKIIQQYVQTTAQPRMIPKIINIWEVESAKEVERFKECKLENRCLLWQGTNIHSVAAILKNGLRIKPHGGGCAGRGFYFASELKKEEHNANFSKCSEVPSRCLMFLNEVALGQIKTIKTMDKTKSNGFDSVVAQGRKEPDRNMHMPWMLDHKKVNVPHGNLVDVPNTEDSAFESSEYIVYKENQCRVRFLVELEFS